MSSFGDGTVKTRIEEELRYIAEDFYSGIFDDDEVVQKKFILDVLDVLRYMCGEW